MKAYQELSVYILVRRRELSSGKLSKVNLIEKYILALIFERVKGTVLKTKMHTVKTESAIGKPARKTGFVGQCFPINEETLWLVFIRARVNRFSDTS